MIPDSCTATICLFGPMRVTIDGVDTSIPGGKVQSLFAYLLLYPRTAHTRDCLVDTLWPDLPADRARHALADTLYRLRAALRGRCLQSSGERIGLEDGLQIEVDVWEFEAAAAGVTAAELDRARALHAAPLLPDIYDDWILARRVAIEETFGMLMTRRTQIAEDAGDFATARELFQELVALDPLHEPAWRGLMRATARLGHLRDALDAYGRLVAILDEEFGAPAEQATQDLAQSIERELKAQRAQLPKDRHITFYGRARERSRLVALVEKVAAGRGGMVIVLGEAGIGRSALLAELEDAAAWRGLRVFWGSSEVGRIQEPFAPLRQALLAALPPARLQQLQSLVPGIGLALADSILTGVEIPSQPELPDSSLPHAPAEIAQALGALLHALGLIAPHILLLDDMQWADPSTWPILDGLRQRLADARVLLVLSGRTGELRRDPNIGSLLSRWDQDGATGILVLGAMDREEIAQTLAAHHQVRLSGDRLEAILDACGGNPRLALALAESDAQGEDGRMAPAIHQLVLRRFDALGLPARTALEAASILGTRFSYSLWRQVWERAGHAPVELSLAAGELERQRQLVLDGDSYSFVQGPLREAVDAQMESEQRRMWHRHALDALRDSVMPSPILLLRHADGASDIAAVAEYAALAGEAALKAHAYQSAQADFTLSLHHAAPDAHALRYRALLGRSRALSVLALRVEQEQDLLRLQEIASLLADDGKRAEVACRMAGYLWSVGRLDEALSAGGEGLVLAKRVGDDELQAQLHEVLGRTCRDGKDIEAASFHIQEAQRLYQASGNHWGVAMTTDLQGGLEWDTGRYGEAATHHRTAADLFRAMGDIVREAKALNNLGSTYWALGDYAGARETHERALAVCRAVGDRRVEADNVDNLGGVAWSLGDYETAIHHYNTALRIRRSIADPWGIAISLGNLGSAYLRKGDAESALDYYAEAYPLYQQVGRKRGEGYVLHSMGLAEIERGNPRAALECLGKALAIRHEVGDVTKIVETNAALAVALQANGKPVDALHCAQAALAGLDLHNARATLRQDVCFAAYQVFWAAGQTDAALLNLGRAEHALDEVCNSLRPDEREQFLANVPLNRQIVAAQLNHQRLTTARCVRDGVPLGRAPRPDELTVVRWTVETPADLLIDEGAPRRRHVLQRLAQQAQEQGASPTDIELAEVLSVSRRTILRDIAFLADNGITVRTRARM